MKKFNLFSLVTLLAVACAGPQTEEVEKVPVETQVEMETASVTPSLTLLWTSDSSLITNESVLFNEVDERIYVSNIDGKPLEKDGKGSISIIGNDGQILEQNWVTGLNAPKGMAIKGDRLYVTDIDQLLEISTVDAKVVNRYAVKEALFLNDVVVLGEEVYFSDMNTGKLHVLRGGAVETVIEGLDNLNGLAIKGEKMYGHSNFGLIAINYNDDSFTVINEVVTGGDGLIVLDESTFLVSRWKGEIWLVKGEEATMMLDSKDENIQTADIGYIPSEKLVLVPRFFSNVVSAYRLDY